MSFGTDAITCLPVDRREAKLIGRVWSPAGIGGPSVVIVEDDRLWDVSAQLPTIDRLLNHPRPAQLWGELPRAVDLGPVDAAMRNSCTREPPAHALRLLAPCDIQAIKACGVTFVSSLLERVIEERTCGRPEGARQLRAQIERTLGASLERLVPGSPEALRLKEQLLELGMWSQYLEVGIGPDAEVFTKAQPLSAVGFGHPVGVHPSSRWNNPEPEVVLTVSAAGNIVGATLGNDVNLRDFEGRSALLLGRAKDNNASCAIGPFIRLLDEHFTMDELRRLEIELQIKGPDGFEDRGVSGMASMSRDLEELVSQAMGEHHQYPDGMMLFTGTMFTPTAARPGVAGGFSHARGDVVRVRSARLGVLHNTVDHTDAIAPWTFGIGALMANLAARGLLPPFGTADRFSQLTEVSRS